MNRLRACISFLALASGLAVAVGQPALPAKQNEPLYFGKTLDYWIGELKDSDALVREEAILVLTSLGKSAEKAVPALSVLLKDDLPSIRVKAALALWKVGGKAGDAVPVLLAAWKGGDKTLRLQLLPALGPLAADAPEALPVLLQAAGDKDEKIRSAGLDALVRAGPKAIPALTKVLDHPDAAVRQQTILFFARLGPQAKSVVPALKLRLKDDDWDTRFRAAQALWDIDRISDEALPVLIEAMDKKDPLIRRSAFTILYQVQPRPKEAAAVFRAALKDDAILTRVQAAEVLWELERKAKDVLPVFQAGLQLGVIQNFEARMRSITALGKLAEEARPARKDLIELLKNADGAQLSAIPGVLAKLGPESIPDLIDALSAPIRQFNNRHLFAHTLGLIGKDSVGPLTKLLAHGDLGVRMGACQAIELLGPEAVGAVGDLQKALKHADSNTRRLAASCLGKIGSAAKESTPALVEMVKDTVPDNRRQAMVSLFHVGLDKTAAIPLAQQLLKDTSYLVKMTALEWLIHLDPKAKEIPEGATDLLRIPAARVPTMNMLGRLGPAAKEAVPAIAAMLQAPSGYERQIAALALERIGPAAREAIPALTQALPTPDFYARANIIKALKKAGGDEKTIINALGEALSTSNGNRPQYIAMLGEYGPAAKDALPKLREVMQQDPVLNYRQDAAWAICNIDPDQFKTMQPFLQEGLRSTIAYVQVAAAMTLWKHDPKDEQGRLFVLEKLQDNHGSPAARQTAVVQMMKAGPWAKAAIPALIRLLSDPYYITRIQAAAALLRIDPKNKDAVPALVEMLQESDSAKRQSAAYYLGELGPLAKPAIPALQAVVQRDALAYVRTAANDALRKIDPKTATVVFGLTY